MTTPRATRCTFIPPWLVERVDGPERAARDDELRRERALRGRAPRPAPPPAEGVVAAPDWTVHDAESRTTLPGTPARSAGEPETGDVAVDEAATGIEATLQMFLDDLGRDSHDGDGAPVSLTVHYGSRYNNAFWDGTQLVFGDGDGRVFERFTKPVDVLAHEFSHARHRAHGRPRLPGPVRGAQRVGRRRVRLLPQAAAPRPGRRRGRLADRARASSRRPSRPAPCATWPRPGTAYDDPELGADPQVGHMDDYVETTADNGGVHLNSGIPNKAFQLAAVAIGGTSISGAGRIWYDALVGGDVPSGATSPPSRRRPSQPRATTPTPSGTRGHRSVSRSTPRPGRPTSSRPRCPSPRRRSRAAGCASSAAAASPAGPRPPRSTSARSTTPTSGGW